MKICVCIEALQHCINGSYCTISQLNTYTISSYGNNIIGNDRSTPVALAIHHGDVRTAADKLMEDFDELSHFVVKEIKQADVEQFRFEITKYFKQDRKINQVIEGHLSRIEDYNSSNAVWNYFFRHDFIGYINYTH